MCQHASAPCAPAAPPGSPPLLRAGFHRHGVDPELLPNTPEDPGQLMVHSLHVTLGEEGADVVFSFCGVGFGLPAPRTDVPVFRDVDKSAPRRSVSLTDLDHLPELEAGQRVGYLRDGPTPPEETIRAATRKRAGVDDHLMMDMIFSAARDPG